MIEPDQSVVPARETASWPPEVDMILSAMDAAVSSQSSSPSMGTSADRRSSSRHSYRTQATLKLYADPADAAPRVLYTRDADTRCAGFITQHLLPLGYGGWVTIVAPNGEEIHAECTIYRCRKTVQGWHEGAMRFNRDVWQFASDNEGALSPQPCRGLRLAQ